MNLAFTTAAFMHHGVPIADVPVLLDDRMAIVESPQQWLF
jgi:hypothetical protein